jgi:hypothetical protein
LEPWLGWDRIGALVRKKSVASQFIQQGRSDFFVSSGNDKFACELSVGICVLV